MRALIINSNPKLDNSVARWFYESFFQGLTYGGIEIEKVYLMRKNINPCKGCLNCWFVEKGRCIIDDDCEGVLKKQFNSDYVIYIAPIYAGNFPAKVFHLTQRSVSALKPTYELYNGHYGHSILFSHNIKGIGVISWCGFHEKDNFNPIDEYMRSLSNMYSVQYSMSIFRPHINYFIIHPEEKEKYKKLMFEAGSLFAKNGYIPKYLKSIIEQEIIDSGTYFKQMNKYLSDKTNEL